MESITSASQLSDEELAAKTAAGSHASFRELISRYSLRLSNYLRYKTETNQDIEDLVQETFFKAFRNIDRFNPQFKFSTWLFTIATRLAISKHRSNKRKESSFAAKSPSWDPQEIMIRKEESQNLWIMAKSLQQSQYKVLWLRYAEDMSVKEIAAIMRKKPIHVRVLLHRARLKLADRLNNAMHSKNLAGPAPAKHKFSFL